MPERPRSQVEVITGKNDLDKADRMVVSYSDLPAWPIGQKPAIASHQKPSQPRAKEVAYGGLWLGLRFYQAMLMAHGCGLSFAEP